MGISVAAVKARLFPCEKETGQTMRCYNEITSGPAKAKHPKGPDAPVAPKPWIFKIA